MLQIEEMILLTRAMLWVGGETPPPRTFPSIAQKQKGIWATKLLEPLPTSILRMLTKGKFRTYDKSAVNDVRVTSCSAILGKNKGFRESLSHAHFKI